MDLHQEITNVTPQNESQERNFQPQSSEATSEMVPNRQQETFQDIDQISHDDAPTADNEGGAVTTLGFAKNLRKTAPVVAGIRAEGDLTSGATSILTKGEDADKNATVEPEIDPDETSTPDKIRQKN